MKRSNEQQKLKMLKFFLITVLFLHKLNALTSATSLQVMTYNHCNDTAIYTCTCDSSYVNWDITSTSGSTIYSVGLSIHDNTGIKYNIMTSGSATIYVELIGSNSTSIASTLTIANATYLLGNSIICNDMEKNINFSCNIYNYLPSALMLTPIQEDQNGTITFLVTWNSLSQYMDSRNTILVISSSYGEHTIFSHNTSVQLSINKNTVYLLKVIICANDAYAAVFSIGRCPFLTTSVTQQIISYTIRHTGPISALVNCSATNLTYDTECGVNGYWNLETCAKEEAVTSTTIDLPSEDVNSSPVGPHTDEKQMSTSMILARTYTIILTACIFGAIIFGIIIGSLIVLTCIKLNQKNRACSEGIAPSSTSSQHTSFPPLYEEIDLKETTVDVVKLSQNIAYEHITTPFV